METLKETPYLLFRSYYVPKQKTLTVSVINIHHNQEIGVIKWYSAWRQYCFFPEFNTIWNKECLNSVNEVITELMNARKTASKKSQKTVGVIARSIEDFQNWKHDHKHNVKENHLNTQRRYVYRGKRYIGISTLNHCHGYSFDEVVETETAWTNSEYKVIVSNIKLALKPGGKWIRNINIGKPNI
jgi:hypothetical protein